MVKSSQEGFWVVAFNDKVYYWQDYYFNIYMATSRWGHRIKIK